MKIYCAKCAGFIMCFIKCCRIYLLSGVSPIVSVASLAHWVRGAG